MVALALAHKEAADWARDQDRAATHGKGAVAANRDILEAKKPASQTH
jgi:hypothetical protein